MRNARIVMLALVSCAACAHKAVWKEVVWPDPPEKPRIKFVRSLRATEDIDDRGWSRFKRGLLGGGAAVTVLQPMGLAISKDGQRLYIADLRQGQVLVADFQQKTLDRFGADTVFGQPFNVALDDEENVYVSDSVLHKLMVFDKRGKKLRSFGDDLVRPTGLALDRVRRLVYVTDTANVESSKHRVVVYDFEGKYLRDVGNGRGAGDGEFNFPNYLALDAAGNLYVVDAMNFRVQVFDPEGKFLRKFGVQGDTPGSFARMKGIAFDGFGNLYVADGEHAVVQIFNREFEPLMYFGGGLPRIEFMDIPCAIAIDPRTNVIYVGQEVFPRVNVYQLVNTQAEDSIAAEGAGGSPADGAPNSAAPAPAAPGTAAPAAAAPAGAVPASASKP